MLLAACISSYGRTYNTMVTYIPYMTYNGNYVKLIGISQLSTICKQCVPWIASKHHFLYFSKLINLLITTNSLILVLLIPCSYKVVVTVVIVNYIKTTNVQKCKGILSCSNFWDPYWFFLEVVNQAGMPYSTYLTHKYTCKTYLPWQNFTCPLNREEQHLNNI